MFVLLWHCYKFFFLISEPTSDAWFERNNHYEHEYPAPRAASRSAMTEDPSIVCRKAGHGRIQLTDGYNVWIDKARFAWAGAPEDTHRRRKSAKYVR